MSLAAMANVVREKTVTRIPFWVMPLGRRTSQLDGKCQAQGMLFRSFYKDMMVQLGQLDGPYL